MARNLTAEWRAIRDAGNLHRHRLDTVAESRVWAVVHDGPPALGFAESLITA